jgi:hypothetical protein
MTGFSRRLMTAVSTTISVFVLLAGVANAQQTLGSLNGTVVDSSGAAVPDANITVNDPDINVSRTTKTGGNGFYQIFNLPIGHYKVQAAHPGFDTTTLAGIDVREAAATTLKVTLKVGHEETTVEVSANPMLNATDTTNGYTMSSEQIELTPLATGSFTQMAILSPGVNSELLSGVGSQAGLGNQPIWANGQRDTSNTFQVNGVDVTNLFNGKSSSGDTSQRYNFNIGGGTTSGNSSAGAATIGGADTTSTSTYGSNGNSLPSPPQEFLSELRVNTSMYDAQQGATSGAQIDVATQSGTNSFHGQIFGTYANNDLNADPYFFKQDALLGQMGIGAFPLYEQNPSLHRWTTGGTLGGPIKKNKLYFFLAYQHLYDSDQASAISQFQVPTGLTSDRSLAGLTTAYQSWNKGSTAAAPTINPIAQALLSAKLPNGQFLIPSATPGVAYAPSIPNVTLIDTSRQQADMGAGSLDYQPTSNDRVSFKYYYQNAPTTSPFSYTSTLGFPGHQANKAQVGALDNTTQLGPKLNWEQRVGYARMSSYSYLTQVLPADPTLGPTFGISQGPGTEAESTTMPGLSVAEFGYNSTSSSGLKIGPYSYFNNLGYYQNRINPSTNVIWSMGKHTILAGGGYNYTQLNVVNNRNLLPEVYETSFKNFWTGASPSGSHSGELSSVVNGRNNANRYYRSNESDAYLQDKWQLLANLSITAGVRWDYHGGLTEKYGNLANFDPTTYDVSGTTQTGFTVTNAGFVIAANSPNHTPGTTDSTLSGRQWGVSPRVGFAWSPARNNGKLVVRGGFGLYYDRGELFSYLSQPAGNGNGGPFGVTESEPFTTFSSKTGPNLSSALLAPPAPTGAVSAISSALQTALNGITGPATDGLQACSALDSQVSYEDCGSTLNFGAYDKNNVLPYTMNYTLNLQWQPRNDLVVTLGYTGNRGRHAVIPIPFNEPQIVTPTNPGMVAGKSSHPSGETQSYGMNVVDFNNPSSLPSVPYGDTTYNPIPGEYWNTLDGGNTDLRAPYIGFSPNSALFETVGNSAYDALETHLEKRMSRHFQVGASYTFSHTLDEQSDIGLFFTGDDPAHLRDSWASADYDRTHVFTANFLVTLPDFAPKNSLLAEATNGWNMSGVAIAQSGEPYSLYEFYGAVGSIRFGNYPTLMNPVLPVADRNAAKTGNSGAKRPGGNYQPAIDPGQIAIQYLQPGQDGIPQETSGPQDTYETNFVPGQRNIFRQTSQRQLNLSFRKDFRVAEHIVIEGQFNLFNILNTPSFDVPQDQAQIRQSYACANAYQSVCDDEDLNYGQIGTTAADQTTNNGRGTAGANLDLIPTHSGSGSSTTIPYTATNANFGSVTNTIGSNRVVTWGFRLTY